MEYEPPTTVGVVSVEIKDESSIEQGTDRNGILTGRWKAGIFGCLDSIVPNAVMSCFCPAVSVAQIAARMGLMEFYHVLGAFAGLYFLAFLTVVAESNFLAMSFWLATIAATLCLLRLRSRLRIIFSIPGSTLEDAFFAVCCGCCSIAQMATHVESYEPGKLAFAPRETLPGYSLK